MDVFDTAGRFFRAYRFCVAHDVTQRFYIDGNKRPSSTASKYRTCGTSRVHQASYIMLDGTRHEYIYRLILISAGLAAKNMPIIRLRVCQANAQFIREIICRLLTVCRRHATLTMPIRYVR